jgi:hypothetical protein
MTTHQAAGDKVMAVPFGSVSHGHGRRSGNVMDVACLLGEP